ncbi:MAG TPA: phosphoadenosine phosphosulfate reductase [Ignavibacteria bacterium]|nr:phosphoadenosine phosphosulfate reductase [Ignavibacteria bacterium]
MLNDLTLFGERDKVQMAVDLLQHYEQMTDGAGYYLAFSGGKDSCVIKELANMAGVKYDAHYNLTTIDPPELVHFIKREHSDVIIDRPEQPFLSRIVKKGFPQRHRRWCCEEYKERGGKGRYVITGIRRAESINRKNRRGIEICRNDSTKIYVNPIIEWNDSDVWNFIRSNNLPYCKLYDEGWERIGCLLCPLAGKHRMIEAERYPKFTKAFIRAFERLYEKRKSEEKESIERWKNGEEMFWWWMKHERIKYNKDQCVMFE